MHGHDAAHFDSWSRTYDRSLLQTVFFGPVQRSLVSVVTSRVDPCAILDIGCGTGRLLERMAAGFPRAARYGIDPSGGMLSAARKRRPSLTLCSGSSEALPFPEDSFDLVTTTLSFHHWPDKAGALTEVRRVLRPGGVLALADPAPDDIPGWQGPLRRWISRDRHMIALKDRNDLVEGAGLEVLDVSRAFLGHWVPLTLAQRPAEPPAPGRHEVGLTVRA